MWTIASGDCRGLRDCGEFLSFLNGSRDLRSRNLLSGEGEVFVTRAPGRLDAMGGIADYSGAPVLQLPLSVGTITAVQKRADHSFRLASFSPQGNRYAAFEPGDEKALLAGPESARQLFSSRPETSWCAYVLGILAIWKDTPGFDPPCGLDILIRSEVAEGGGISSSAALEVSTAAGIAAAYDVSRDPVQLALDCQQVENLVVGAPCGVMDQMTAACGEANRLLRLLCQPAEIEGHLPIPPELRLWGIDSRVRHSVAGSDYERVRVAAFMGHRILAEAAGLTVEKTADGVRILEDPWRGYLANIPPARFDPLVDLLPEELSGSAFLEKYAGTIDTVTRVDSSRVYPVRAATAHPVYESHRIREFADRLGRMEQPDTPHFLGRLMYDSHESYNSCGLGSPETDLLVELAGQAESGIYGAKITGGGSGGTVAILGRSDATDTVAHIASRYAERSGQEPRVYSGSSMGASSFGVLRLRRE